jgi:hypothetical protein
MRTINVGTVSSPAANTLLYNFLHTIGADTLETNEGAAALRSFNKYARFARQSFGWPEATISKQIIPDVRVRAINVTNGGSGYDSGATVAFSGGGGSGATATATTNSDEEVNGIAVTAAGTGYTSAPTVTINAVSGGSGATATAVVVGYIDYGSTIGDTGTVSELLKVTEEDPLSANTVITNIPFQDLHESGSEYGLALLLNRSSTAPVWATYRYAEDVYVETGSESGNQKGAMPYVWSEYVVMGAYADWLRASEQHEKARVILKEAREMLMLEVEEQERQGRSYQPTEIHTHHSTTNIR